MKQGYQQFQEPRGTSVIKVKGVAKVIGKDLVRNIRMLINRILFLLKIRFSILKGQMAELYGMQQNINFLHLYDEQIFFHINIDFILGK